MRRLGAELPLRALGASLEPTSPIDKGTFCGTPRRTAHQDSSEDCARSALCQGYRWEQATKAKP